MGVSFSMEPILKVSEIIVTYSRTTAYRNYPKVISSADAHRIFKELFASGAINLKEYFYVLNLNQANSVIAAYKVSEGGITSTVVDIRLILGVALKVAATGIIISHNHPSGEKKPSRQDEVLTSKMREAAKLLDIRLLDHIILTDCNFEYYSFADSGML